MTQTLPDFYEASQVGALYVERGETVAKAAFAHRQAHHTAPAAQDDTRIALFGIDCQVGFCHPEASLFVPGAVDDTRRTIEWIYHNLDAVTTLFFSLDTHSVYQIFHAAWWVDQDGNHPPPMTPISSADIKAGRWRALQHPEDSLAYCRALERRGKYTLTIWPYHTLLGGTSHALVPALMEAALFHSITRQEDIVFESKGQHPQTENYSVLSPEVKSLRRKKVGRFRQTLFDRLMAYDRIYVCGQAKSHCVLSTLQDIMEQCQKSDPSLLDKIYILTDTMSPVPAPPLDPLPPGLDFPAIAEAAMLRFQDAGMHLTTTAATIAP